MVHQRLHLDLTIDQIVHLNNSEPHHLQLRSNQCPLLNQSHGHTRLLLIHQREVLSAVTQLWETHIQDKKCSVSASHIFQKILNGALNKAKIAHVRVESSWVMLLLSPHPTLLSIRCSTSHTLQRDLEPIKAQLIAVLKQWDLIQTQVLTNIAIVMLTILTIRL